MSTKQLKVCMERIAEAQRRLEAGDRVDVLPIQKSVRALFDCVTTTPPAELDLAREDLTRLAIHLDALEYAVRCRPDRGGRPGTAR